MSHKLRLNQEEVAEMLEVAEAEGVKKAAQKFGISVSTVFRARKYRHQTNGFESTFENTERENRQIYVPRYPDVLSLKVECQRLHNIAMDKMEEDGDYLRFTALLNALKMVIRG